MNMDMGRVVSVFGAQNFKLLGCAPGKIGAYILSRAKSIRKAKAKLRELTSRSQGRNVCRVMENVRACLRDWSGCFEIASMKSLMIRWDEWLRRRFRVYIWNNGRHLRQGPAT